MKDIAYLKQRLKKINYYLSETVIINLPGRLKIKKLKVLLESDPALMARVNYYCKDRPSFVVSDKAVSIKSFKKTKSFAYFADTKRIVRYFSKVTRFDYLFGDIIHIPDTPCFLKSRPISEDNQNSVLLKLNSIRHYQFVQDNKSFESKKNLAVWRGHIYQEHRQILVDNFHSNKHCDIGHCDDKKSNDICYKGFLSIDEQLSNKYIISVEGKDVATNLKWIMSSNSLCFMRRPRYETWFMEGRLEPNVHYVELNDDFSNLEEKIHYYNENPSESLEIINNAQAYTQQFLDRDIEEALGILVAEKYFKLSNQI